jgi:hypothetical protein
MKEGEPRRRPSKVKMERERERERVGTGRRYEQIEKCW